jgi:hypothetical protein
MAPYFNAGVIAVAQADVFGECWMDTCLRIDREPSMPDKRPWLDQIGLPVTIARLGLGYRSLGNAYNFPAHLMPLTADTPYLCHYHWPNVLRREPSLLDAVASLSARHPTLVAAMGAASDDWRRVLQPSAAPTRKRGIASWLRQRRRTVDPGTGAPEILISGIPRSGTSLLCRLLDDQPNSVIVNEPTEVFGPLQTCDEPSWMACFYRDLRCRILEGEAIENRVVGDRLVEDTRLQDVRSLYHPRVSGRDFLLGTKNTLAYLSRIEVLRRAMPDAPIVACVRHPMDTVASWKGSFPHLREADLTGFPAAFANPSFLTGLQQERLRTIVDTASAALRRALLWAYLADLVIDRRDSLLVVRYEELAADPDRELGRILAALPGLRSAPVGRKDIKRRTRRDLLDDLDRQAIRDICAPQAERLGYEL